MAIKKILIPSGIGDFSWAWSKLVTTNDQYHIEYVGGKPDRMTAYLSILPKDRIVAFMPNNNYYTKWDENGELICISRNPNQFPTLHKVQRYSDLRPDVLSFLEINTFLERGNRIEGWFSTEMPKTDFHYILGGSLEKCGRGNYFIVNYSSYGTKKAWGYYDVPISTDIIQHIVNKTGWAPLFIGGTYDDYTQDIYIECLNRGIHAVNVIGKTPDLCTVTALLQQAQAYIGACSGLMVLANVLNTPVCAYYPPFKTPPGRYLAGTWHDTSIPYASLFWEGKDTDLVVIDSFLQTIKK